MKKIVLGVITVAVIAIAGLALMRVNVAPKDVSLEWREVTPADAPLLESLRGIFIEAFTPISKAYYEQRIKGLSEEKRTEAKKRVDESLPKALMATWDRKMQLYTTLGDTKGYIGLAKDAQGEFIGFVLVREIDVRNVLQKKSLVTPLSEVDLAVLAPVGKPLDQVFVDVLAVKPGIQKKGLGKKLVLTVLDYCPLIKKIYLDTPGCEANKNTQGFYEHVGFKQVMKIFVKAESAYECEPKIVYLYQKP